jgi:hypothetical protein
MVYELPHRWKTAKDAVSHTMLGKVEEIRLAFSTVPTAPPEI